MNPARVLRGIVLAAHLLLIVALPAWTRTALGVAVALPLLLPLRGLWRGEPRTYAWASMLVAFYVAGLLAEGYASGANRPVAFALAAAGAAEFVAQMLFVRVVARRARAASAARTEA